MATDFEKMKAAGWFENWPESAIQAAETYVKSADLADFSEEIEQYPGLAMMSVFGDAECIYEEDAYTQLLKDFTKGSHGLLEVEDITEEWLEEDGSYTAIKLSATINGTFFSQEMAYMGDWISVDFFKFMESILEKTHPGIGMYNPDALFGQDFGFLYISVECLKNNSEHGLLPAFHEDEAQAGEDDEVEQDPYDPELACQLFAGFDDVPEVFPIIYRYDLKGLEKYLDDGGDIEVCDSEWESTPVEHVHTACSFAGEEYFSHFEKLFDLLYDRGAKIERPGENFFFRVLIAADDDPFYDKLKSMKLKPSAETLNNALDVVLNFEDRPDHAERLKKDFG